MSPRILSAATLPCGHTIEPVRDEPQPHKEAINGPHRAGSPVASSPIRCVFHRFTLVVSSDRSPLLLLARCGTNFAQIMLWINCTQWPGDNKYSTKRSYLLADFIRQYLIEIKNYYNYYSYQTEVTYCKQWWLVLRSCSVLEIYSFHCP